MRGRSWWYPPSVSDPILELPPLRESDVDVSPFGQFDAWFHHAQSAGFPHANAATLATSTRDGIPNARIVLLKGFDPRGFVFFTNYESQKGRELAENPRAAMVFFWPTIERQVRIIGAATKITTPESEAYFQTRPRGSQIGAWASPQSRVIEGREPLERALATKTAELEGKTVPLPPNWGGFRLAPTSVEFWQSRPSRLHDRLRYTRRADNSWRIERLAP